MPAVEVRSERYVAGGDALARDTDGRVVFVRGAMPGEVVEVEITERKRDFARARLVGVVSASSQRIEPPCPQRRAGCGGCDWQHVATAHQLEHKVAVVVDALRRTGRLDGAAVLAGASVPPTAYRTTVRVVGTADRRAGYRREHSHDTVEAAGCLIAHPGLLDVLAEVRVDPGAELTLRTSAATGELTAIWAPAEARVDGLPAHAAVGQDTSLVEEVDGHRLRVSAGSFFQSGPAAAAVLADAVRRAAPELRDAGHVVDAYGGVGLFGVTAVPANSSITLIETSRSAVADARVNLAGRPATFVRSEFGRWRPDAKAPIDVVIADPARTGLARPGVTAVAATHAPIVVLVSCDPVSLARDTHLLGGHGYRHESTEVVDVFPQTHHVETVTRLTRAGTLSP